MSVTSRTTDLRSLPAIMASLAAPVRRALASDRLRWWGFGIVTVAGWLAVAAWIAGIDAEVSPADDGSVWWVLLLCGLVGTGQALFALPLRGRKTGLLRWWQWLLLILAHIAIVAALAVTLVHGDADAVLEAVFDVVLLGGLGWVVLPLALFTVLVVIALFIGFVIVGVAGVVAGVRAPRGAALTRARALSGGIALLGAAIALVCLVAAIPFMGLHYAGKGSALAAIVVLLLEAVRVVPGPPGWLHELDRDGYLLGIVAIVQYLTFRLWGPRIWRDATPGAAADEFPRADGLPPAQT